MNRLRTRLILVFAIATLVPLAVTLMITTSLLERSLSLATTQELDLISRSLEETGRAYYQALQDTVRSGIADGTLKPRHYSRANAAKWPALVREFDESKAKDLFRLTDTGNSMEYYARRGADVAVYSKPAQGPELRRLAEQISAARATVRRAATRDFRKGFLYTMLTLVAGVWVASLIVLILWAGRISRPMEDLTAGLTRLADGDLNARLTPRGHDEVGQAMAAFNNMAEQLQHSRDRLVHITRLSSWQTLARKMAHEVKNSLTPIRLTMEELLARKNERDDRFMEQAAQIVVDEVATLERRVRAFSDFSAEPPVNIAPINVNALIEDRIALLRAANQGVIYNTQLTAENAVAKADEDLVKGVLTNLLENAAQAAGPGGVVLGKTAVQNGKVTIEIHDSGPGLSVHAKDTLFEPTISFKKAGMGLGLSIAKRSALMLGGDIVPVEGDLGGAAFRFVLPRARDYPVPQQ